MTAEAPVHDAKPNLATSLRQSAPAVKDFFIHVLGQARVLKKAYPGLMHALIFWGVTTQVIGTAVNLMQMQLFIPFVELPFPRESFYLSFELVMDLAGVAILAGILMAAFRRTVLRPRTLETKWDDAYALILLALIPLAGFSLEACRLLAAAPAWSNWSPVGSLVATTFASLGVTPQIATSLHPVLFWTHLGLGLALVASLPFTKLRHLVYTPLNVIFRSRRKDGVLEKVEDIDNAEILGVGKIAEFKPQQLLSFDACVRCGRCEEVCPAANCGMAYTPKSFIQRLQGAMTESLVQPDGKANLELLGEAIPENLPWSCTTCGACLAICPAFVNPVDEIIDLRRYQTLTTGKVPKSVADVLRNMERYGNPWGMPPEDRTLWAEGLNLREIAPGEETDVLLFLGCAFAYDERNKAVARSFARLLQQAGVDFAILGLDEMCCGETARRLGHEYLFQTMAEQNIALLSQIKFKRIVTQCPHCFNTLKNEYPQMGGDFDVLHYTQFLMEILPLLQVASNGREISIGGTVTIHDPCYLGRHNHVIDQPRQLLRHSGEKPVEMARKGADNFCCGGGGGQMWMESDADARINHLRLEQALETKAKVIATACPYCLLMFDDAIRTKGVGEEIKVFDIAEILDQKIPG